MSVLLFDAHSLIQANTMNFIIFSSFLTTHVTGEYMMLEAATSFNGDISKWDVSSVTNMFQMFNSASSFNSDVSKWDVSSVTQMSGMFRGTTCFNTGCFTLQHRSTVIFRSGTYRYRV